MMRPSCGNFSATGFEGIEITERVQLVWNGQQRAHGSAIVESLRRAHHFECMVAFAKSSALKSLLKPLEQALARGMTARFAIGLSFHLTEPSMLRKLLELSRRHAMELYLSDTGSTFHPKIYAARAPKRFTVIVGSANLTAGGFDENYEASALISGQDGALFAFVASQFDSLIAKKAIVLATKRRVDAYAAEFTIQEAWRRMAKKRADSVSCHEEQDLAVLAEQLAEMKRDDSPHGFAAQRMRRKANLRLAWREIEALVASAKGDAPDFLMQYEALIRWFHSGGLHRAKTRIARESVRFLAAITDIASRSHLTPAGAFELLRERFEEISGAGVNLLTEILHTLDNKRYAVMNQNAVIGLAVAGFGGYPARPTKKNVDGESYERYCRQARSVQASLGLSNLTELDALFNYVYWRKVEA